MLACAIHAQTGSAGDEDESRTPSVWTVILTDRQRRRAASCTGDDGPSMRFSAGAVSCVSLSMSGDYSIQAGGAASCGPAAQAPFDSIVLPRRRASRAHDAYPSAVPPLRVALHRWRRARVD